MDSNQRLSFNFSFEHSAFVLTDDEKCNIVLGGRDDVINNYVDDIYQYKDNENYKKFEKMSIICCEF